MLCIFFESLDAQEVDESHLPTFSITTIESNIQEEVDENHPIVQQLIAADFTKEQSIDAVKKFQTVDAAFDYLNQTGGDDFEDQNELEHSGLSNSKLGDDHLLKEKKQ